jgi:hypothetical protein
MVLKSTTATLHLTVTSVAADCPSFLFPALSSKSVRRFSSLCVSDSFAFSPFSAVRSSFRPSAPHFPNEFDLPAQSYFSWCPHNVVVTPNGRGYYWLCDEVKPDDAQQCASIWARFCRREGTMLIFMPLSSSACCPLPFALHLLFAR